MTAAQWVVLDNIANRWPYGTNLARHFADGALKWAQDNGYVKDGRITDAGRVELLRAGWKFDPEEPDHA